MCVADKTCCSSVWLAIKMLLQATQTRTLNEIMPGIHQWTLAGDQLVQPSSREAALFFFFFFSFIAKWLFSVSFRCRKMVKWLNLRISFHQDSKLIRSSAWDRIPLCRGNHTSFIICCTEMDTKWRVPSLFCFLVWRYRWEKNWWLAVAVAVVEWGEKISPGNRNILSSIEIKTEGGKTENGLTCAHNNFHLPHI